MFIPGPKQTSSGGPAKNPPQISPGDTKLHDPIPPKAQSKSDLEKLKKSIPLSHATAVLIVENEKVIDWTLSSTIAEALQQKGITITKPSVFNNSFLIGGGFSGLFNGGSRQIALTQLPRHFKTGILGKKTVTYMQNTDLSNLITASMTLELHVVSSQTGAVEQSVSFSQKGAGFSNADASKIAEENILREFETQIPKIIDRLGN